MNTCPHRPQVEKLNSSNHKAIVTYQISPILLCYNLTSAVVLTRPATRRVRPQNAEWDTGVPYLEREKGYWWLGEATQTLLISLRQEGRLLWPCGLPSTAQSHGIDFFFYFNFPIHLQSVHTYVRSSNGVIKLAWRGALNSTPPYETGTMPMLAAGKRKPYKL
jgi:hypothetical protein